MSERGGDANLVRHVRIDIEFSECKLWVTGVDVTHRRAQVGMHSARLNSLAATRQAHVLGSSCARLYADGAGWHAQQFLSISCDSASSVNLMR